MTAKSERLSKHFKLGVEKSGVSQGRQVKDQAGGPPITQGTKNMEGI